MNTSPLPYNGRREVGLTALVNPISATSGLDMLSYEPDSTSETASRERLTVTNMQVSGKEQLSGKLKHMQPPHTHLHRASRTGRRHCGRMADHNHQRQAKRFRSTVEDSDRWRSLYKRRQCPHMGGQERRCAQAQRPQTRWHRDHTPESAGASTAENDGQRQSGKRDVQYPLP